MSKGIASWIGVDDRLVGILALVDLFLIMGQSRDAAVDDFQRARVCLKLAVAGEKKTRDSCGWELSTRRIARSSGGRRRRPADLHRAWMVKRTLFGIQNPNAPVQRVGDGDDESAINCQGESHVSYRPEFTISSRPLLHNADLTLSPPVFYHRATTMSPSPTTDQDPVPFLDDQDESVRIAVKALGDMRNSRPQPSASTPARMYNLPPSPSSLSSFVRLLIVSTRVPFFTSQPRGIIFNLTTRLRRRCEFSRFCRSRINNTSRKHRLASLRTNESKLKGRQSTILFFTSLNYLYLLLYPAPIRV